MGFDPDQVHALRGALTAQARFDLRVFSRRSTDFLGGAAHDYDLAVVNAEATTIQPQLHQLPQLLAPRGEALVVGERIVQEPCASLLRRAGCFHVSVTSPPETAGIVAAVVSMLSRRRDDRSSARPAPAPARPHDRGSQWTVSEQGVHPYSLGSRGDATRAEAALRANEFHLLYQPIINPWDRSDCGAEALLRWDDPKVGRLMPAQFVPVLERTGMIRQVGAWVLQEAAAQLRIWRTGGLRVRMHVNVSPVQFKSHELRNTLRALASQFDDETGGLHLEITESVLLDSTPEILVVLKQLSDLGVRWWIDDFGAGYGSLAYLQQMPIHGIKIDRRFIDGIPHKPKDWTLVQAMVELGQRLGLRIVAEGVTTERQAECLSRLGVDGLQGFLFSTPVEPAVFSQRFGNAPAARAS